MTSKETQESSESEYSTHHKGLILTLPQEEESTTERRSYLQSFHELPSLKVDDVNNTGTEIGTEKDIVPSPTTQTTRTATQVTSGNSSALMLVPRDSPLVKRGWISDNPEAEDDDISSAVNQLKKALKEVKHSGKQLQKCHEENAARIEREKADHRREQEYCQQELKEFKEKCAKLTECNANLRQQYELKITSLENDMAKLQLEKKKEDTSHTEELEQLKKQYTEEKKDLFHTIQAQAKSCRKMDSELEELKTNYARKEKDVEKLRKELTMKERELNELGQTVRRKEEEVEAIKKDFQEEKDFMINDRVRNMLLEKEEISTKLKTCQGISELVSRLPNITNQEERDKITEKVMSELSGISRTHSTKRAKSWR